MLPFIIKNTYDRFFFEFELVCEIISTYNNVEIIPAFSVLL